MVEALANIQLIDVYLKSNWYYQSNCEYEMDFENEVISIRTVREIENGEELFINYNGSWNDKKPVWFDAE